MRKKIPEVSPRRAENAEDASGAKAMSLREVPLSDLHEDPKNLRLHSAANRKTVRSSLERYGQVEVLVVEKGTGLVIGGNCRLAELRAMGRETAWVSEVDVHGAEARRLGVVLNRTAELASWSPDLYGELAALELGELFPLVELSTEYTPPTDMAELPRQYLVLVECPDEATQRVVLARCLEEGWPCRALM